MVGPGFPVEAYASTEDIHHVCVFFLNGIRVSDSEGESGDVAAVESQTADNGENHAENALNNCVLELNTQTTQTISGHVTRNSAKIVETAYF